MVMDAALAVTAENSAAARDTAHMDVFMLTQNHGGKERTQQEFMALASLKNLYKLFDEACKKLYRDYEVICLRVALNFFFILKTD